MQQHLDAVELVAVAEDAFHSVPAVTQSEIVAAADTSYVVVANADAAIAVVIAVADAAIAASAYGDAGYAFDDASAIQREADCPVHRARCLDDRQRLPEVCNWHTRWEWTDVRWGLVYVPCGPYRYLVMSTCNQPCHPYFRVPVGADSRPHFACRSDYMGETLDKACPVDLPWFHNGGRRLLDVTNSDRRVHHQFAETVAEPIVSAEAPVRPHRSAADADASVPPHHFAGLGCTNSRSTNSCYCPTCPTCSNTTSLRC